MRNIFITLIFFPLFLGLAYAEESLESELKQLRKIGAVTGSAVGIAAAPGDFFKLSKIFIQKGKEEDFLKLTSDANPVVRAMGLLCLAQHKKSISTLKEHLTDKGLIHYCAGGCTVWTITVGNFVRKLLNDANHLEYRMPHTPVLSENELIGLDIEILAKDSTTTFHDEAARSLSNVFKEKKTALTLLGLRKYVPDLETYEIIKAIGRLGVSSKQREFLISCVQNKNLDEASRLAAASALTRDSDERLLNVIERERAYLNSVEGGNWGDRLLQTLQNRISHENVMRVVRAKHTRREIGKVDDTVIRALSNSHPLALPDLTNDVYLRLRPPEDICSVAGNSLVEMSKNLERLNQPWNTYSDTAYALGFIITTRKGNLTFDRVFTQARRLELEKNIQNAIKNHFEE